MVRKFACAVFALIVPMAQISDAFAAAPSRDGLVIELPFEGSLVDTSGNGRKVASAGVAFRPDDGGYADFSSGSGQVLAALGWAGADSAGAYTVSFRIKSGAESRTNAANMVMGCPNPIDQYFDGFGGCRDGYGGRLPLQVLRDASASVSPQTIFSAALGGNQSLTITSESICQVAGASFDCSDLNDGAWHSVVIRKNGANLKVFLDGIAALSKVDDTSSFGKAISIGRDFSTSLVSKFKGAVSSFRVYSRAISDTEIADLSTARLAARFAIPTPPVITISEPSDVQETSKRMTASVDHGSLTMSVTKAGKCDASLPFDEYSDLTFTSISDNGSQVCYRGSDSGYVVYRLSKRISGVTGTAQTLSASNEGIFDEKAYLSWPSSLRLKSGDFTYRILTSLNSMNGTPVYYANEQRATDFLNFVDLNGDGLVDVLYNSSGYRSVLLNNGDLTFRVGYKCRVVSNVYYGDCADVSQNKASDAIYQRAK